MAQLRREVDSIHAHGAELVVIGTEHFAEAFREDLRLDTPLYVDTTRASYRALGMKHGIARTLASWRTWAKMLRALRDGVLQKRVQVILRWWYWSVPALVPGTQGDAWQLGGIVVVLPDGRVPYSYLSTVAGDHPPVNQVLAALEASTW
ncbi:MAG: AhpC/TSA family protein [Gemmatimonadota bacterium]